MDKITPSHLPIKDPNWVTKVKISPDGVTVNGKEQEEEVAKKWREIWEEECEIGQHIWEGYDGKGEVQRRK